MRTIEEIAHLAWDAACSVDKLMTRWKDAHQSQQDVIRLMVQNWGLPSAQRVDPDWFLNEYPDLGLSDKAVFAMRHAINEMLKKDENSDLPQFIFSERRFRQYTEAEAKLKAYIANHMDDVKDGE